MTKKKYSSEDASLDTLLDLHGEIFPKVHPYEFESASQLMEDFWEEVEEILK